MIFLRLFLFFLFFPVAAWIYDYFEKYDFLSACEVIIAFLGCMALITAGLGFFATVYNLFHGEFHTGWFIAFLVSTPTALICYLLWRKFTKNY